MRNCTMPDIKWDVLCSLAHVIFKTILWNRYYYYPKFIQGKINPSRAWISSPKLKRCCWWPGEMTTTQVFQKGTNKMNQHGRSQCNLDMWFISNSYICRWSQSKWSFSKQYGNTSVMWFVPKSWVSVLSGRKAWSLW